MLAEKQGTRPGDKRKEGRVTCIVRGRKRRTRLCSEARAVEVLAAEVLAALTGGRARVGGGLPKAEGPCTAALLVARASAGHVAVPASVDLTTEAVGEGVATVALLAEFDTGVAEALGRTCGRALRGGHGGRGEEVAGERARGAIGGAACGNP